MTEVHTQRSPTAWHTAPAAQVLAMLGSGRDGLTGAEAQRRLGQFGPNAMPAAPAVPAFAILAAQFRGVVVLMLVGAAAIALAMRDLADAAAIGAVLAINATLGFVTEWRARRAMDALRALDVGQASVLRDGALVRLPADRLVPGDVVRLDAGSHVPADARLIDAADLRTSEAALTGEPFPVGKRAHALAADAPLAERRSMVYKGTTIAAGTGTAVVVSTGAQTEVGRLGALVAAIDEQETPLERRLDALGRHLAWLVLAIAAVVAAAAALEGAPLLLVVETGIALAVAAVPEALPAVATIALAVGMRRMARRRVLVRRPPAVETLGSVTVVCTDKTRTLTSGEMAVVSIWTSDGEVDLTGAIDLLPGSCARTALESAAVASRPQPRSTTGPDVDPVDGAVLAAAEQQGIDRAALIGRWPAVAVLPFSSERRLMAAWHQRGNDLMAFVKGAPATVVQLCAGMAIPGGWHPLDASARTELLAVNEELAARGLRVLAVASGSVHSADVSSLQRLTFEGFLGLADPPAAGVKEAIARMHGAGLGTVMVTGDQRATAIAIGRQLGIVDRDGDQPRVFFRVTPEDKLRIVESLQARGEIVAMLGDGINDAAALKKADVGVAMGARGTDVAREAAAIVLQDDRFEAIAAAVEEGRVIFDNIRKVVFYLFSCNVAEILVLVAAVAASLPLPLLPLQLLWLNLITDTFPALALAVEPADDGVMRRPPRDPDEAILSRPFLATILGSGAAIAGCTLVAFLWRVGDDPARAATLAFMTLALAQVLHLGTARSTSHVLAPSRAVANVSALAAVAIAIALQALTVVFAPLRELLGVTRLDAREWTVVIALAAVPALAGQAWKVASEWTRNPAEGSS